jgi:hypothetical protein
MPGRRSTRTQEIRKNALVSSFPPPHVILGMATKRSSDNLNDKGKIRYKPCLMTTDTGTPVTTARERTDLAVCPADCIRGNSPSSEWALIKLTLGWYPLRARCQWIHSGAGCLACQQHIYGFGAPRVITGSRISAFMAPKGMTAFIIPCKQQQSGCTGSVHKSWLHGPGRQWWVQWYWVQRPPTEVLYPGWECQGNPPGNCLLGWL